MEAINITINDDAKEIGFAELMGSLIRENCLQNKKKAEIFSRLSGKVKISAIDADVSIILEFLDTRLIIRNGKGIQIPFEILATSEDIITLSNIKLFLSFPFLINSEGIRFIKKIATGKIIIKGIFSNILFGINLLRVISLN